MADEYEYLPVGAFPDLPCIICGAERGSCNHTRWKRLKRPDPHCRIARIKVPRFSAKAVTLANMANGPQSFTCGRDRAQCYVRYERHDLSSVDGFVVYGIIWPGPTWR